MLTVFICLMVTVVAIVAGYIFGSHFKISIDRKTEYKPTKTTLM